MTVQTGDNNWAVSKFIVDPTAGQGTHTTITSALAAASSGDVVAVRQGTYPEDPVVKAGVTLTTLGGSQLTPTVTIVGKVTMTEAGRATIYGIRLQTDGDFAVEVSGSAASILNLEQCYLDCTDNTGISHTSSDANSLIQVTHCYGNLGTTGIKLFEGSSAGNLRIQFCEFGNSGGSTTASTISSGILTINYSNIFSPITSSGTSAIGEIYYSFFSTANQNVTSLTCGGSGTQLINKSSFYSGTASAVSVGTVAVFSECIVNSTNAVAITGAGTVTLVGLNFIGSSNAIDTTTQRLNNQKSGARSIIMPAGDYTVLVSDYFVGATTSAARAITLPAAPSTGEIHVIKDITPNAATFNITISGNGKNILGTTSAATYVINVDGGSVTLIYNGTLWCVV